MAAPQRRDSSVHCSSSSISRTELKEIKLQEHLHLNGDEGGGADSNPVLQKLQKWADYPSYGTSVAATKFLPMKTPMSTEIIDSWSLPKPPAHVLTVPGLLAEQRTIGRTIGLIIDLSNHETLYAEDLAEQQGLQYAHIQLVAKAFPGRASINQVIKTARSYWRAHPENYIAIHCAYGFNRTGFVVCAYLIQECGQSVQGALDAFAAARPPGVKHEKFVVELHRRYGQRLAPVPPTPDPELADGSSDTAARDEDGGSTYHAVPSGRGAAAGAESPLGRSPGGGGSAKSSVAGRSPQTDPGSSLTGGSPPVPAPPPQQQHSRPKMIRLYPEPGEATPWEPGTPNREACMATQQVWDALSRGGPAAAYRVRTASELSIAGSADGGGFGGGGWPEGPYSSLEASDGRISCSSLFSEFGAVAAHLEERHPGLAAARSTVRPLPPRSTTSEASVLEDQQHYGAGGARASFGSAASGLRSSLEGDESRGGEGARAQRPPSPLGLYRGSRESAPPGGLNGGGHPASAASERRVLQPGLLSASLATLDRSPVEGTGQPGSAQRGAAVSPIAHALGGSPPGEPWHACLDSHPHSRGGSREHSLSLAHSSLGGGGGVSGSVGRAESAHSLVNNESLGLDERMVFENFNKLGLSARRKKSQAEAGAEEEPAAQGRMSIQDLQRGVPSSSPALASHGLEDAQFQLDTEGADLAASPGLHDAVTATPFAAAALQAGSLTARSEGSLIGETDACSGDAHVEKQGAAGAERLIPRSGSLRTPQPLGQKLRKRGRCSLM